MICDEGEDLFRFIVRHLQAAANFFAHANANFDVAIEADTVAGFRGGAERGRFADIVQEHAPGECHRATRGDSVEHQASVDPNVAFRVILGRLLDAFHRGNLGQDLLEKPGLVE